MFSTDDTIVAVATPPGRAGLGGARRRPAGRVDRGGPRTRSGAGRSPCNGPAPGGSASRRRGRGARRGDRSGGAHLVRCAGGAEDGDARRRHSGTRQPGPPRLHRAQCHGRRRAPRRTGELHARSSTASSILVQAEAVADLIPRGDAGAGPARLRSTGWHVEPRARGDRRGAVRRARAAPGFADFPDVTTSSSQARSRASARPCARRSPRSWRRRAGAGCCAGCRVALAGAPNVGKLSLFNALLGSSRAIVTPLLGTTVIC